MPACCLLKGKELYSFYHLFLLFKQLTNMLSPNKTIEREKIALPTMQGITFVNPIEIIRCKAQGAYTTVYMKNRQLVISRNIKVLEEKFSRYGFLRVHKSHLINLAHIARYIRGNGGIAVLSDGSEVEISKRRRESFLQALT
jgi:two-component system, LytTR family, response regulator